MQTGVPEHEKVSCGFGGGLGGGNGDCDKSDVDAHEHLSQMMRSNSWQQPPFLDAIGKGSCGSTAHIADPILLVGAGSIVARHAKWELTASLCIAEICKRCKVVVRLPRALARLAKQQSLRARWGDCILLLDSDSLDDGHARFCEWRRAHLV